MSYELRGFLKRMRTLPQETQSLSECNFWGEGRLQNFVPVDINEAEYALRKVVLRSPVVSAMAVRIPGEVLMQGEIPSKITSLGQ